MCRESGGGRFSVSLKRVMRKIHLFHFFFFFFLFRLWQCITSLADKRRQIIPVVHIFNEEIVFCALVRRTHFDAAQQRAACLGRFQIEAVIADEAEDDAVAIDAVVAEHLFHRNLARTGTLVGDVLNEVGVACHGGLSFVIAQKYEKNPQSKPMPELRNASSFISFYCFDIQLFILQIFINFDYFPMASLIGTDPTDKTHLFENG